MTRTTPYAHDLAVAANLFHRGSNFMRASFRSVHFARKIDASASQVVGVSSTVTLSRGESGCSACASSRRCAQDDVSVFQLDAEGRVGQGSMISPASGSRLLSPYSLLCSSF